MEGAIGKQLRQHILNLLEALGIIAGIARSVLEAIENVGEVMHDTYARPRPFPYDTTTELQLTDGGVDTFGNYVELIPIETFDFGDTPNYVQVEDLVLETLAANDVYVLEFYRSTDGVTYTPIGAIRTKRQAQANRSFTMRYPCRPFNNDTYALYGRLKGAAGAGTTILFSLSVGRWVPPSIIVPISTGVWPTG